MSSNRIHEILMELNINSVLLMVRRLDSGFVPCFLLFHFIFHDSSSLAKAVQ